MSTLKTHNLQSPDAGSVNIVMAPNAGMVVAGISTFNNKVLIGTNTVGDSTADDLTIATSGSTGITLRSDSGYAGNIQFADGTSGDDQQRGVLQYHHSDNSMRFMTNASERIRIGSVGQLGIGGANYGTSGQVLTSQGNSSAPTWATPSGGLFASYAQVCDRKSSGSHGGSFSSGDWRTRELNTEAFDPDGIVTLSSNQFTLQAGSYFINAMAPAQSVVNHQLRLRNITDSNNALFGFSAYASQSSGNATDDNDYAFLKGRITLSGAKTFELQHRCNTTRNGAGFGQPTGYAEETYASVEIYKEN